MKIGPITIGRRVTAADAPPAPPRPSGASGTINYRGFLQTDEYNRDLQGDAALVVFDKMLRSDGSVQEAVEHVFAPIKNATATVEAPENPSEEELVATALVEDAFFETLQQPWLEYLDQALDYLTMGFAIFERSWRIVERELQYQLPGEFDVDTQGRRTPKTVTVPSQQWLVWDRFEQRLPRTVYQWGVDHGKLVSVTQSVYDSDTGQYTFPEMDADQLLVLTAKRRGDQFTGKSILRAAYKAWYMKELIEKIEAVSVERWGVGLAVGYLPQSKQDDNAAISRLEDILANVKAGESSYVVMPGFKQGAGPQGNEGYLLEIIGPTGTPPDFKSAKEYHRAEIKAAVLARFAELGHAQTGARSTGDTQSKVWYDALHAVARYLQDVHAPAIRQLVDYNLTGVSRYPKIQFSGIEARDLREYADAQSSLVGSGAIRPDATYRGWVREEIDAPPEDEIDETLADPGGNIGDPTGAPTEPTDQSALTPVEQQRRKAAARAARRLHPDQLPIPE